MYCEMWSLLLLESETLGCMEELQGDGPGLCFLTDANEQVKRGVGACGVDTKIFC